jgi:hypothetical protein
MDAGLQAPSPFILVLGADLLIQQPKSLAEPSLQLKWHLDLGRDMHGHPYNNPRQVLHEGGITPCKFCHCYDSIHKYSKCTIAEKSSSAGSYRGKILGAILAQLILHAAVQGRMGPYPIIMDNCNNLEVVQHRNKPHRSLSTTQTHANRGGTGKKNY